MPLIVASFVMFFGLYVILTMYNVAFSLESLKKKY